jgi:ammonium transporter Rh
VCDLNVMVFVGFGLISVWLKRHAWTSLSYNFLMGVWAIQLSVIIHPLLFGKLKSGKVLLDLDNLIMADYMAAAVMIMLGTVNGKVSFHQVVILSTFCVIGGLFNASLMDKWELHDYGLTIRVFLFAALYGFVA